jgi:hypothetical protein
MSTKTFLLVLISGILSSTASAQTPMFSTPPTQTSCPADCKGEKGDTGPRGPQGPEGPRGAQGPPGRYVPPIVPPLPGFDLGVHGFIFLPGETRLVNGQWMLLTYEKTSQSALMIDLSTCMAQVHMRFDAGIGAPLTWGSVDWVTDQDSIWYHEGAMWSHRWDPSRVIHLNLNALRFDDPKLGAQTPLCRWR